MPRGDRTGPCGAGAMTGRGAGFCAGFGVPGYANPGRGVIGGPGRAFGAGRGIGRGLGINPYSAFSGTGYIPETVYNPGNEKDYLLAEKNSLENTLKAVNSQLEKINEKLKKPDKTEGTE